MAGPKTEFGIVLKTHGILRNEWTTLVSGRVFFFLLVCHVGNSQRHLNWGQEQRKEKHLKPRFYLGNHESSSVKRVQIGSDSLRKGKPAFVFVGGWKESSRFSQMVFVHGGICHGIKHKVQNHLKQIQVVSTKAFRNSYKIWHAPWNSVWLQNGIQMKWLMTILE